MLCIMSKCTVPETDYKYKKSYCFRQDDRRLWTTSTNNHLLWSQSGARSAKFMPVRTGPSLPKALLEELDNQADGSHRPGPKRKTGQHFSRKEARKQERHDRKQRKAEFFISPYSNGGHTRNKRHAEHEHPETPHRKKAKVAHSEPSRVPSASEKGREGGTEPKQSHLTKSYLKRSEIKPKTALGKLAERSQVAPHQNKKTARPLITVIPRSREEEEEETYIAYLESKLGWRKGSKRTAKYGKGDDGLDDLLKDLDAIDDAMLSRPKADSDEDIDEEFEEQERSDEEEGDRARTSEEEDVQAVSADEDDEWHGFKDTRESDADPAQADARQMTSTEPPSVPDPPVAGSRYVPPHMRNRAQGSGETQDSEAQIKLTRQLKGLLNRMSEQNIASIIDGIEETYRNNRRHDVTSTLTTLIIDGISAHSILLDSYVVLHAAFVSALHKLIGVEFAAYFVQNVITSYERHFAELEQGIVSVPNMPETPDGQSEGEILGKECSNLIVLLSELYNFQVISCVLVHDIIRGLLEGDLTEFKVELLLKITKNSGPQLRQDDPTALKSIIQIVHNKLPAQANAMSSRTRFMVETLTNLKNNKIKRNAGQTAGNEAVERMKKFLSGLSKKRHVLAHEPLRVSLEDLRSAESKGKWWLVGAAWGGDPLVEHQDSHRGATAEADSVSENVLLKLARKQGMNTEIRRGIFVVLMSSEDYVDACERLSQLKLTEVQQREIIRVILHCCGNEKSYNPYYTLVGQQLCRTSHSHKVTLQFCLWDFLRDLGESNVGGAEVIKNLGEDVSAGFNVKNISNMRMRNVAKAYSWWIAKDCCTLAVLKPVDFTILKPQSQIFLRELIIQLFVSAQLSTPILSSDPKDLPTSRNRGPLEEVFLKATRMQALTIGLVYFIGESFKGDRGEDSGFLKWASQVAIDTLRTGMDVVAGL
ncbi:hypothetical protein AcV5_008659 [Taiwanofungus camphoratus]|nr:hypothetical protein AcV5_008659 [Antrodia cinnamomea]